MSSFGKRSFGVALASIFLLGSALLALRYGMKSDEGGIPSLLSKITPIGDVCQTSTTFKCASCMNCPAKVTSDVARYDWKFDPGRDSKNTTLTEKQCLASFPGLYEDIDHAKKFWNGQITRHTLDQYQMQNGTTRAIIFNGELYVIATRSKDEEGRRKTLAALSSIYRAVTSAPHRKAMPNTEFIFSAEATGDDIGASGHPLWVLGRKATESFFLMPDSGFWASDNAITDVNAEVGPFDEVVEKVLVVERNLPFDKKEQKLVWRGKLGFAPRLRKALLDQAESETWADVEALDVGYANNYLALEDHCKYQFIAHAEGSSYSASLKYRQACHSVPVIHKMQYIQHHHYLLVSEGPLQNYVEVERDFSDLPRKMSNLLDHPEKTQKIADNNVKAFRNRYLTQAAEACYWRQLFDGYGQVARDARLFIDRDDGSVLQRGMRYETFMLMSSDKMLRYGPVT